MDSFADSLVRFLTTIATVALILAGILHFFFVRLAVVEDDNMAPTLLPGERIVIWRDAALDLSDIAVCRHPSADQYVIGRVVARPPMTIASDIHGHFQVDGRRPESRGTGTINFVDQRSGNAIPMATGTLEYAGHTHEWMARPGEQLRLLSTEVTRGLYLLNDNRAFYGNDSRTIGEVDPETCIGQVVFRLQPTHPPREDIVHGWMQIVK